MPVQTGKPVIRKDDVEWQARKLSEKLRAGTNDIVGGNGIRPAEVHEGRVPRRSAESSMIRTRRGADMFQDAAMGGCKVV